MEHRQAFSSPMRGGRSIVVALRFFCSFFTGVEVAPSSLEVYPRGQPLVFADPPVTAYRPIALPDETMNFRMAGNCYCAVAATLKPASKNRQCMQITYILHREYRACIFYKLTSFSFDSEIRNTRGYSTIVNYVIG